MRLRAQTIPRLILPVALALAGAIAGGRAAPPQDAALQPRAATNTAPAEPEVPKSVFIVPTSPKEGRDPFYPNSPRLFAAAVTGNSNAAPVQVALLLSGIFVQADHRLATINNHTFEVGEESEVLIPGGRTKIRCVEIKENSVVVEVRGERRELRLDEKRAVEKK
jgi:hypothetical protein